MAYTTHKSLLERLKTGDEEAWRLFYETYYRFIVSIGQRYHFDKVQCQDLVQQVMIAFFEKNRSFEYNPEIGKFRSYLWGMTRNIIVKIRNGEKRMYTNAEDVDLLSIPTTDEKSIFEEEWRKHLLSIALKLLQGRVEALTFDAFQMYVLQQLEPAEVAQALGISVATVYVHKNRCVKHLKQIVSEIQTSDPDFTFFKDNGGSLPDFS